MSEWIETAFGSMTVRPDGILHVVFDFDDPPTEEATAEFVAARNDLVGWKPPPVIVEIVHIPYVDRSVRGFLMGSLVPPPCRAVVTSDPSFAKMFRTYGLVDPAEVPSKYFATIEAAVAWIHNQIN